MQRHSAVPRGAGHARQLLMRARLRAAAAVRGGSTEPRAGSPPGAGSSGARVASCAASIPDLCEAAASAAAGSRRQYLQLPQRGLLQGNGFFFPTLALRHRSGVLQMRDRICYQYFD